MRKNKRKKGAIANRQRGGAAEETQLRSRRNEEGAEMRGLKRQTGGADGRRNTIYSKRNAPAAERRSAGLSGRQRAAVSRRQLAAPAPLLSIINLARALFPTTGAFSLCSPPPFATRAQLIVRTSPHGRARIRPLARYFYSLRTIFPAVIPRSCSFCAQLRHAAPPRGRLLVYKESKRVNK